MTGDHQRNRSLEAAIRAAESPVELLRDLGVGRFTALPDEFTNWIEEQRAWRETCALFDLSYHMSDLELSGPDAVDVLSDLAVNRVEGWEYGQAKQLVVCNPAGYFIGDGILTHLGEEHVLSVGPQAAHNWIEYHVETGDYDATAEVRGRPVATGDDPKFFRYQVQGPTAIDVMHEAIDEPLGDLSFFNFAETAIDDVDIRALRHGMAGEPGFEFWGAYDRHEAVLQSVLEAGKDHGIRRIGARSYQVTAVLSGWMPLPVPAIYDSDALRDYREWLPEKRGLVSIGGSFDSADITDYYVTPFELGYGRHVDFDREFVGREALIEHGENQARRKVTLVWNPDDVVEGYGTLFRDGDTAKFMDLPTPRTAACHYDTVRKGGEPVGVSKWMNYEYNERSMLSLALVDVEHSEPGTELTVVWGEAGGDANPQVERHVATEIDATVALVPYIEDRR
jgi:glycine cleavage system aminomethyltransferase T